jgi:NAD(P)-dependent dehydrogenase (short-subunit alcohol dehydrogenase family)
MGGGATFDFSSRVVFITGGGTGIGKGLGDAFAAAGATVVVGGRRREPLEAFCAAHPDRSGFVQMDVGVDADRRRTIDEVIKRHGRLDVLVNNAIAFHGKPFEILKLREIEAMYNILLIASTALTQIALPHLIDTKGSVINISSVVGRYVPYPPSYTSVYAAAKAGVNQLTRALASELGAKGVRLNAIAPGVTRTEAADGNEELASRLAEITPMGRIGEPGDIAGLALYLASDAGRWVTGQVIDASGGWGLTG